MIDWSMIDDTSGTSDVPRDVHIIMTLKVQMLKMVRFNLSILHLILELKQLVKKEGQTKIPGHFHDFI